MNIIDRMQRTFSHPHLDERTEYWIRGINNEAKDRWDDKVPRDVAWLVHDLRQRGVNDIDVRVDYFPFPGSVFPPYEILLQSEMGRTRLYRGKTDPTRSPVEVTRQLLLRKAVGVADDLYHLGFQPTVMGKSREEMRASVCENLRTGPIWYT